MKAIKLNIGIRTRSKENSEIKESGKAKKLSLFW
jgi:hypothetical protein